MANKPYVIGICGGTCSGKSTISEIINAELGGRRKIIVIHMDTYYKRPGFTTIAPITRIEYHEANHPDSLEVERMRGDFTAAANDPGNDIVIIEGLFAFYFDDIRERLDLKVYIDLKSDERMYRRIKRWINRTTLEDIVNRYLDTVRYRHDEFVEPLRWHADIVINGTLEANLGTRILLTYIKTQLES